MHNSKACGYKISAGNNACLVTTRQHAPLIFLSKFPLFTATLASPFALSSWAHKPITAIHTRTFSATFYRRPTYLLAPAPLSFPVTLPLHYCIYSSFKTVL
jgi:hypothetical protein